MADCRTFLFGKENIMKFAEKIFERATVKGIADYKSIKEESI